MFDVEVTGYEDAMNKTNDLIKDINQFVPDRGAELVSTAESILKCAKEICNDPDCQKIKRVRIEFVNNEFFMNISFADPQSYDCMIQAIAEHLHSMPEWQKQFFEGYINNLEEKKKNNG